MRTQYKMLALAVAQALVLSATANEQDCSSSGAGERPPNFIIILTDDQGYADLGCYGSTRVQTPNIDAMARNGIRFTDFYAQTVCGPSRAALMTGCYPIRVGEPGNRKYQHTILHTEEVTLAEQLKELGYATACIGKWHLGEADKDAPNGWNTATMPNAQGFDYFYGTPLFNGFTPWVIPGQGFRSQILRNEEVVIEAVESWDFITGKYTEEALTWLAAHKNRPFFLYLAHNMPHIPLGAGPAFKGKNPGDPYADAVEEIDWSVGRILEYLSKNDLNDITLVVFLSDNGPWIEVTYGNRPGAEPRIPREHSGTADPLRGYKMLSWEGGPRVPCIMQWPGKIPAGATVEELITSMDLYPTFVHLAGGRDDSGIKREGVDISDVLMGPRSAALPDRTYNFYVYTHLQAVRQGPWKLVLPRPEYPAWTGWSAKFYGDGVETVELYNLDEDISETSDVSKDHQDVVKRMMILVEEARGTLGDYDRIGKEARFFEDGSKRPGMHEWKTK